MGKRKKSQKGKSKSLFPHQLTISACPSNRKERIITDAGFESIDCQLALQYFPLEEIFNYWEYAIDLSDVESEDEVEKFEELMNSTDYYSFNEEKQKELLNSITTQFSWLPLSLDIATARAVYEDYKWVKAIAIQERYYGLDYIDSYETEAINLGLYLKQEIGNPNLSVINDNKHAVSSVNGIISFEPWFLKEFIKFVKENKPTVFWSPRKFVKQADRLSIRDATRVFSPDDELFEPNYDEYYEFEE